MSFRNEMQHVIDSLEKAYFEALKAGENPYIHWQTWNQVMRAKDDLTRILLKIEDDHR